MNNSIDIVIMGEGEFRFLNLLNSLNEWEKDFDSLAYKKNNEVIINPMKTRIEDVDKNKAIELFKRLKKYN